MASKRGNKWDAIVSKNIRRYRNKMGLTQSELADILGVRFQQVQKYETGVNRVSAGNLKIIANALDVNINKFYLGEKDD